MKPRLLCWAFAAALAALAPALPAQEPAAAPARPPVERPLNVLLIISDDLRCELGCYGVERARTPHIDALAAAGVRFERAYCQFPLCNPSRSSMLTGRYPLTTGVLDNRAWFGAAHPEWRSLPRWFKDHGYATLRTGKIFHGGIDDDQAWTEGGQPRQFGAATTPASRGLPAPGAWRLDSAVAQRARPQQRPAPRGALQGAAAAALTKAQRSDRWIVLPGEGERNGDYRCASRAIELLGAHQDEPFFLAVGFSKPHSPPAAPQSCYDLYPLDAIELPVDFAPRPTVPPGFPAQAIRAKNADLFIGRDASIDEAKAMTRAYLASASFVDRNVGRVIAELDRLGLRESTIVVFWGDHGYQLGEKGKWSKAGSLWEQGARTPLILLAPGAAGNGRSSPRVVEMVDLYPTLVELCGLPAPAGLEGRSLVPLLADPTAAWDHPAFTIWSEDGRRPWGMAVRTEKWRYAEYADGAAAMLLDETADPHELKNLADDPAYAQVRNELSALVRSHRARPPNRER
jgi:arylsulfatase A-like enzyme